MSRIYDPVYKKKYYRKNKKKISAYWKRYYKKHKKRLKKKQAKQYRESTGAYLFYAARARAKTQGVPFDIEKTDIQIPDVCPVFGTKLVTGGKNRNDAPSLDKIRPELGYVKGNIAIISMRANRMKQEATLPELKKLVAWLERGAEPRDMLRGRREVARLSCGHCRHLSHPPGECNERVMDAAGDIDWCPCQCGPEHPGDALL